MPRTTIVDLVAARSGKVERYQATTVLGEDMDAELRSLHEEALTSSYVTSVFRAQQVTDAIATVVIAVDAGTHNAREVVGSYTISRSNELHFFATKDYCTEARTIALFQIGTKAVLDLGLFAQHAPPLHIRAHLDNLPMLRLMQKMCRTFPILLSRCAVHLEGPIVNVAVNHPGEALSSLTVVFEPFKELGRAVLRTCPGVRAELAPTPFDRLAENAANLWRRSKKSGLRSGSESEHASSRRASESSAASNESLGYLQPAHAPSFETIQLRRGMPVWVSAGDLQWRAAYWKTSNLMLRKYDGECRQHAHIVYAVRAAALDLTLVEEGSVQIFPLHSLCYVAVPTGETVLAYDEEHCTFVEAELM